MFTFSAPGVADELAAILRYGEDYYGRGLDACMWSLMVDQAHLVCGYVGGTVSRLSSWVLLMSTYGFTC